MNEKTPEAFKMHFETLSVDEKTQKLAGDATIVPGDLLHGVAIQTLDSLPRLSFDEEAAPQTHPDLRLIGTLGEGGMGIVRLATQVPLQREVAVKTLRRLDDQARASLLLEAHVTGHLEHPNIVPVYTLGQNAAGAPVIVMKRIEGISWLELLRSRTEPSEDLDRHLEILIHVTNALRFAHSKGIVHRDIKPENVMIGNFGEVYLLDWGIAISLGDSPNLPRREEARGLAGTPAYMAPEMTRDDAIEIDFRSDVYLAGATLHEVLTGQTRHQGDSLFDLMYSAYRSDPYDYGETIPSELAAIANRACAAEPDERYPTIDAFQEALQDYFDHRGSLELTDEAEERLKGLIAAIREDADEALVHDFFGECRFGFEQALRTWPDNDRAVRGRQRAFEQMIHFYIEAENVNAARSLLGEMHDPPDDLRRQLEELVKEQGEREERFQELQEFASEYDLRTAATSRSIVAVLLGIFWAALALRGAVFPAPESTPNEVLLEDHFIAVARNVLVAAVILFFFRKRIFRNVANRRLMYLLMSLLGGMFFLRLVLLIQGDVDVQAARVSETIVYAFAVVAAGVVSDLRLASLAVFYLAAAIGGAVYPELHLYFVSAANILTFSGFAWFWRPSRMDRVSQAS